MRVTFILLFSSLICFSQQSKKYQCELKTGNKSYLITETLELMPDDTYSWWSTYDLAFEIKGTYTITDSILTLTEKVGLNQRIKTRKYLIGDNRIYMLNEKSEKISSIKEKSLRGFKSWLKGYKFKYIYREVDKFTFDNN